MRLPRWLVPAVLAFQLLLSLLQLLDAHRVWYFPLIHGSAYSLRFDLGFSLFPALLPVSATILICLLKNGKYREVIVATSISICFYLLFGMDAAVAWFSVFQVALALWHLVRVGEFLFWLLVFLTGFEVTALFHWVLLPLGVVTPLAWFADLELALFYVGAYLVPLLVLPFMFMWILKSLLRWGFGKKADFGDVDFRKERKPSSWSVAFLLFSISLSVVAAVYPYCTAINSKGLDVGVDIPAYVRAGELVEQDLSQAFIVRNGSRPFIFFVIYGFQRLLGSDVSTAVRFLPVILNPLMIMAVFFFVFQSFGDWWISSWAAFFTACGYEVTVGMYSYYLTNILGLCLAFLSLGFLFRSLRRGCKISLASALVFGVLLVFTHPWTFDQYYAATVLTTIISWYRARDDFSSVKTMLVYVSSLGLADVLKAVIFGGIEGISAFSGALMGFEGVSGFWMSSIFSFRLMYGGLLSNITLFSLALVGIYLMEKKDTSELYLAIFLAITSLFFFIGNESRKSRLIYNIPIGLFAALGFTSILKWKVSNDFKRAFILVVALNLMIYLFRSLANLV